MICLQKGNGKKIELVARPAGSWLGGGGGNSEDKSLSDAKNAMLKKGPGLGGFMAVLTTMQSTVEKPRELEESSSESDAEGSEEDFVVHPEDYPINLQLVYHLLVRNAEIVDADMRYYLLDSVRSGP